MPHALTPSQVNSINLMTTYSVDKVFVALLSFFYCMQLLSMKERAQIKEEEVRRIILEIAASSNLAQKLELVDTLQRIGVDYHYKKEISDLLCSIYKDEDGGSDDLYITSLRFYLLRRQGYTGSAGTMMTYSTLVRSVCYTMFNFY